MYFKKILSRSYQEIELSPMVKIKGLPGKHYIQECVEGLTGTNAQRSTQISSGGDLSITPFRDKETEGIRQEATGEGGLLHGSTGVRNPAVKNTASADICK